MLRFLARTLLLMVVIAGLILWVGSERWGLWWAVLLGLIACVFVARRIRPREEPVVVYPSYRNTTATMVKGVLVTDTTELMAPYEEVARRLVQLVKNAEVGFPLLTKEQQRLWGSTVYLDQFLNGRHTPEYWLQDPVEIRSIGHRLNNTDGFGLMLRVAQRADELSERPGYTFRIIESNWATSATGPPDCDATGGRHGDRRTRR